LGFADDERRDAVREQFRLLVLIGGDR
jgi:hypothetical protein